MADIPKAIDALGRLFALRRELENETPDDEDSPQIDALFEIGCAFEEAIFPELDEIVDPAEYEAHLGHRLVEMAADGHRGQVQGGRNG